MTAVSRGGYPSLRVGRVLRDSLRILGSNLPAFFSIGLLAVAPVYLVRYWHSGAAAIDQELFNFAAVLVESTLGFLVEAAVVHAAFRQLQGRRASFAETVATGMRKALPVLLIGALVTVLMVLGLVLLIVPGFIVMVIYWVTVPAAVVENLGVADSLRRSASLTNGCRWGVLGVVLVAFAVQLAAELLLWPVINIDSDRAFSLVVEWLLSGATTAFYGVVATVTYRELRLVKESAEVDEIAAVFD